MPPEFSRGERPKLTVVLATELCCCTMTGRPPRKTNPELCARIEVARLKWGISLSTLAREVGLEPSTLCRAMKDQAFSSATENRIETWLGKRAVSENERSPQIEKTLTILDNVAIIMCNYSLAKNIIRRMALR
jgi:hypothetical protein